MVVGCTSLNCNDELLDVVVDHYREEFGPGSLITVEGSLSDGLASIHGRWPIL